MWGYGTVHVAVAARDMTDTIVMDNKHWVDKCSGVLAYHDQTGQYECFLNGLSCRGSSYRMFSECGIVSSLV